MLRKIFAKKSIKISALILALVLGINSPSSAQNPGGALGGIVVDQNGAVVPGVRITVLSVFGTLERAVATDMEGFFSFPLLPSGEYALKVEKEGFDTAEISSLVFDENAPRTLRIVLRINPVSASVKIDGDEAAVENDVSETGKFSRRFIRDLPLNGNVVQSLINLTPGVVLAPVNSRNLGQFSVNGQRTNANYFTLDGVSVNFGTTNYDFLGQTGSGTIPAQSVQGGLDNLISSEALEEVKIQTTGFEAFSGRTPGAQVALFSRAGSSRFSFSAFGRVRSEAFNAKDYFDTEKPPFRFQNFGGYLSGPVKLPGFGRNKTAAENETSKTFFFLAYENRKFLEPQPTLLTNVPSLEIRADAGNPVTQAIFNSFPLPNDQKDEAQASPLVNALANTQSDLAVSSIFPSTAGFKATYSDPNRAENYSLRIDRAFSTKVSVFARFNYSHSMSENRNPSNLSSFAVNRQATETLTIGSTQIFTERLINEIRINLSGQKGQTVHDFDGLFGGKLPEQSIFMPASFDPQKTIYRFTLQGLPDSLVFSRGNFADNRMRQINVVDNWSYLLKSHELKFGFDYRKLTPTLSASEYGISYEFNLGDSLLAGTADRVFYYRNPRVETEVVSFSSFLQDNWKINQRLNLLFGLRWEINPSPTVDEERSPLTLAAAPDLDRADQTDLKLAPPGTSYYRTRFDNFAPRLGLAWQMMGKSNRELILRAGAGTFYDLGQAQFNERSSPFDYASELARNLTLPAGDDLINLISNSASPARLAIIAAAADYVLPRTYFWSLTAQQRLGRNQMLAIAYVGGAGRKLQRTLDIDLEEHNKNPGVYFSREFSKITYIDNAFASDYHALQIQFARQPADGLQVFANYAWSHSIDNYSSDSNIPTPRLLTPVAFDRGNSDFDARHVFNAGFRYQLPSIEGAHIFEKLLKGWVLSGIFFARSGLPFDVRIARLNQFGYADENLRADLVDGAQIYLKDANSPTGQRLNPDAFAIPVDDAKQGNLGRNSLAGLSAWQLDLGFEKKFELTKKSNISFRWDIYNVFNHPNFSNPYAKITDTSSEKTIPPFFGIPIQTMARGYKAPRATGGMSPVFQTGGARAMQFSVRFSW